MERKRRKNDIYPLVIYSKTDLFGESYFTIHLDYEELVAYTLPERYKDATGHDFWYKVAEVAEKQGGGAYFHRDDDGHTYLYVNSIPVSNVKHALKTLIDVPLIPSLKTIVKQKLRNQQVSIQAWIEYTAKYGRTAALQVAYELEQMQNVS